MKKFYVYKKAIDNGFDDIVLLRTGFNLWAFVFNGLWLFSKGLWVYFVPFFTLFIMAELMQNYNFVSSGFNQAVFFSLKIIIGFEACFLLEKKMLRKGYKFDSIIFAKDQASANLKYFEMRDNA